MSEAKELITRATKVATGYIPIFGPVISEIIDYGTSKFEQKKLTNFMEKVEISLENLELELDKIKSDEFGFSYFLKATKKWLEESEKEKIDCYVNCVKNGYISEISITKKVLFLNVLDRLTYEHLLLLDYFNHTHFKNKINNNSMILSHEIFGGTQTMFRCICENLPQYNDEFELLSSLIKTLEQEGLIKQFSLIVPLNKEQTEDKWTTKLGDEFLSFINSL